MDYMKFVDFHRQSEADISIGCLPVDYERASDFGLMKINEEGRIVVSGYHYACDATVSQTIGISKAGC